MSVLLLDYCGVIRQVFPLFRYEDCENTEKQSSYLQGNQKMGDSCKSTNGDEQYFCWTFTHCYESLRYKHSLLQLSPNTEMINIRWLKDLNCWSCDEKHHFIRFHVDLLCVLLAEEFLVLTRSIQILRQRKVQTDDDDLRWINRPHFGHFLLWVPSSAH